MSLHTELSPKAEADLDDIWVFTESLWGETQAEAYLQRIASAVDTLAQQSSIGRAYRFRPGYRQWPVGSHVIFYRPAGDKIEIIRILHQRMNALRHL